MSVIVQFTDSTSDAICAYFALPPVSEVANLGSVETSDARWATYYGLFAAAEMTNGMPAPTST